MRKADRLFQIIQILRRSQRPVTAAQLSIELEVAERTIYRDIADLMAQRVPIQGEAGVGYVLAADYSMPPLMFTPDEIEAVLLGAQMVERLGDRALTHAARDVVAKIAAVVPDRLLPFIDVPAVDIRPRDTATSENIDTRPARQAIRNGRKLRLRYRSADGEITERIVWPVTLGYADNERLLIAWCEMRAAFRHFRLDRVIALEETGEPIGAARARLRRQWEGWREAERQRSG
jgi:predicted DNA-binding transcriptional regulator YafY